MNLFTNRLDRNAQALDLLTQRQQVLAGNIANADTPGFKARDFDFSKALAEARGGAAASGARAAMASVPGGQAPAETGVVSTVALQYRTNEQPSLDGNSVDMDRERAAFADNAVRYEATLRFINHDVRTMLSAITGQ
ncbi:MAG: flagellar basal body rod protein FlgB [Ramlibacter sp.]|nr:flagellar basal body rod protein FlgB [Ramlibacter sp.]